jgi:hypothetical protein
MLSCDLRIAHAAVGDPPVAEGAATESQARHLLIPGGGLFFDHFSWA